MNNVLSLVKIKLGIKTDGMDILIESIIKGALEEFKQVHKIVFDLENNYHVEFLSDFCTWRYQARDTNLQSKYKQDETMPRHLEFRLHNLIINEKYKEE